MAANKVLVRFLSILVVSILSLPVHCGFPKREFDHSNMAALFVDCDAVIRIQQNNNTSTASHDGDILLKQTNELPRCCCGYTQDRKTTVSQDDRASFTGMIIIGYNLANKMMIFDDKLKSGFYDHLTLICECNVDDLLKQDENKAESSCRSFLLYFHPALTSNSSFVKFFTSFKLPSTYTNVLPRDHNNVDFRYSDLKGSAKGKQNSLAAVNAIRFCMQILCLIFIVNRFLPDTSSKDELGNITKRDGVGDGMLEFKKGKRLPKRKPWDFVFSFRAFPGTRFTTYPFSLNQYADEIVKENKSSEELMKYEWSRYLSFKTFPKDSVMTPMRLSQAGFYYTGHGEEVKCFCCGVTNGHWTTDERAIEVHRRLSPRCTFISGESSNNVEIHNNEYYNDIYRNFRTSEGNMYPSINGMNSDITPGAAGGPVDTVSSRQITQTSSNTNNARSHTQGQETNINASNQTPQNQTKINITNGQDTSNIKHPEYMELTKRHESFHGSPLGEVQDPMLMAQAGFFYAGMRDFVRCYYCGIGLKNWVRGDNPWSEHNRWSKSCGHLLHSRGNWSRTQAPQDRTERSETWTSSNENTSSPSTVQSNNNMAASGAGFRSESNDTDSIAARSVMEMGYSRDMVTEAIQKYKNSHSAEPPNAEAILEKILDMEDGRTSSTGSNANTMSATESLESPRSSVNTGDIPATKKHINHKSADARALTKENKKLREQMICKICLDRNADVVFLPCGHMVSCQTCAVSLKKCAVCRKLIRGSVRVYQS